MKECGECGLCCKVMAIKELKKPAGMWCFHWQKGIGCTIYETRPQECEDFNCIWLVSKAPLPSLFPKRCKAVLAGCNVIPGVKGIGVYKDTTFKWSQNNELSYFTDHSPIPVYSISNVTKKITPVNKVASNELDLHNIKFPVKIEDDFDDD